MDSLGISGDRDENAAGSDEIVSWLCVRLMRAVPMNLSKVLGEVEESIASVEETAQA